MAVAVLLVAAGCGSPTNVSVASGKDAASTGSKQDPKATDTAKRRVQEFGVGSKVLECDFDVMQGTVLNYRLSTPHDVDSVKVTVVVSPTYRVVHQARLEVSVSLHPNVAPSIGLRPKEAVLRSRHLTTTTLPFIGKVAARGAKYDVRVGLHARCGLAGGRVIFKDIVTTIEGRPPRR